MVRDYSLPSNGNCLKRLLMILNTILFACSTVCGLGDPIFLPLLLK